LVAGVSVFNVAWLCYGVLVITIGNWGQWWQWWL